MRLSWVPFPAMHIPLWEAWMNKPHVQAFWFLAPHQIEPYLRDKINGNGYDTAYLVLYDDVPIGYLQSTNLFVYAQQSNIESLDVFSGAVAGDYAIDLFIGEEHCLGQGYGSALVQAFTETLLSCAEIRRVWVDPHAENAAAIRCYQKAGFQYSHQAHDGRYPRHMMVQVAHP